VAVSLGEVVRIAADVDERPPLLAGTAGEVEHQIQVDVDEARHVLGALDVTAHPVDRIGDAAQHCRCSSRSIEIMTSTSGSSALTCGSPASHPRSFTHT